MKRNVRLWALAIFLALPVLAGCATLKAAAKKQIRQAAYKGADKVVERVLDRLEISDEARAEIEPKAKEIAREEIDKVLSDEQLDEAAKAEDEGEPDAPDPEPAPAAEPDPAPEPH